jgi:fatty acyl-CoA reductase
MLDPERVTILEGDITKPEFGLPVSSVNLLRDKVNIVVHCASSISLGHPLERLSQNIIGATEGLANFALQLRNLERFVYISTAYSNAHLFYATPERDVRVEEQIYQLSATSNVQLEWSEVQKKGTSIEYQSHNFPWAYAYAKQLTERLLCDIFSSTGNFDKLLILRPSIIAPAQRYPYSGFSFPLSTPMTIFTAATALWPSLWARISTRYDRPETEATTDQVPVDVVVDRLLAHLAFGTTGPVHAVSGGRARRKAYDVWTEVCQFRRWPWGPRAVWMADDWHSDKQHFVVRQYVIMGTSFLFSDDRTTGLRDDSSDTDLRDLELFTQSESESSDKSLKKHQIWCCMNRIGKKSLLARWVALLLYRSYKLKDIKMEIVRRFTSSQRTAKI